MFNKTTIFGALGLISIAGMAIAPSTAMANLDRENAEQVDDVVVSAPGIQLNHVVLKIINNATKPNEAVFGTVSSHLKIHLAGYVKCAKGSDHTTTNMHFGIAHRTSPVGIDESQSLYKSPFNAAVATWYGNGPGWITESAPSADFSIPLSEVKQGPGALRFNPIIEFKKKMAEYVQGGGEKAEFLRNDQNFIFHKKVTLAARCREKSQPFHAGWGTHTITVLLDVKYEGNPNIKGGAQVNAMSNQLQAPFMVNSAKAIAFKTNPTFSGPSKMKFRLTIKASGAGSVKYRLVDHQGGKSPIHNMTFNNEGTKVLDFSKDVCMAQNGVGGFQANVQNNNPNPNPGAHSWRVEIVEPIAKTYEKRMFNWSCINPKLTTPGGGFKVKSPTPKVSKYKRKLN